MTISSLPVAPSETSEPWRSVFTGTDVCLQAGLALPEGVRRPVFDDDVWDFTHVIGLPVQMRLASRRFDFAAITDPQWRLADKELIFAMLVPRHEAVAPLPRAYRTALHLSTADGRLIELTGFLDWLTERGTAGLGDIDASCCEEYLADRRHVRDGDDIVVGQLSPATRRSAAQIVVDLVNYRELFTADRVAADLRPWGGATASAIAEMPSGRTMNKTLPLEGSVLQPLLAAALYLVFAFGPHAVELNQQVTEADRRWSRKASGLLAPKQAPAAQIRRLLGTYERDGRPLPLLPDRAATGAVNLASLGPAGSHALVLLLLDTQHYGFLIAQIFFGLWLVPLGYLAYTSGMFPRALGVLLIAGGACYLAGTLAAFLIPGSGQTINTVITIPSAIAEICMVVYLLVIGVRTPTPAQRIPAPGLISSGGNSHAT